MGSGAHSFPRCASAPCGGGCGAPPAVGRRASQRTAWRSPAGKTCRAAWRQGTETLVSHTEDVSPFPRSKRKEKGREAPTTFPTLGRAVRAGKGRSALCWRLSPAAAGAPRPAGPVPSPWGRQSWTSHFTSLRFPATAAGTRVRLCELFCNLLVKDVE